MTSHEQGNAWYDSQGYEKGDKCAWTFGSALGFTGSGLYNQAIGSGRYTFSASGRTRAQAAS